MTAISPPVDFTSRLLVVDDDSGIRTLVSEFLGQHGYQVDVAGDAAEMRSKLAAADYDLVVLDVMMPNEDGLHALKRLQADGGPPVIMLSAMGSEVDRIIGLELGADDYLPKPCSPRELLARVRTVLRRQLRSEANPRPDQAASELRFAGWTFDLATRVLRDPGGVIVNLSNGEFHLLRALAEHPRRVLSRDQLLNLTKGNDAENFDRAIDVQMSRLRRKLSGGTREELIRTIRSEGYMFLSAVKRR
ncbi:response regulator [Altericroceibacterium xinjiangense]|uniref:response regulator n=1 Tax=Altericroceibacterium xinjiangense TaxID=762261 RepID=UPI000F7E7A2A|nr:response regulator [Altericroceibacterium xinjiangense]